MNVQSRILVIQPECREYRIPFHRQVAKTIGDVTILHFGKSRKFTSDRNITELRGKVFSVASFHFIQGLFRHFRNHDVIVAMHDVHWVNLFIAPILYPKKKFVFWGHGKSHSRWANLAKRIQKSSVTAFIAYSEEGAEELGRMGVRQGKVFVAPNTVEVPNHTDTTSQPKNCFLYVGRMQKRKRIDLLLLAFADVSQELGDEVHVLLVGDGSEEIERLSNIAKEKRIEDRVDFIPAIHDPAILRRYFAAAYGYVSPGHVGLGVLHSFSYGVPVVTFAGQPHGPEFLNIVNGSNGLLVENVCQLSSALVSLYRGSYRSLGRRAYCLYVENRTLDMMVQGFISALLYADEKNTE